MAEDAKRVCPVCGEVVTPTPGGYCPKCGDVVIVPDDDK